MRRHPLPDWYQNAKLGIFVHWGLYSVPGWAASRKDPYSIIAERGFDAYFRENPYAEWYLNSMKFDDGPTRAYYDRLASSSLIRNVNIALPISTAITLLHPGRGFR